MFIWGVTGQQGTLFAQLERVLSIEELSEQLNAAVQYMDSGAPRRDHLGIEAA